MVTQTWKTFIIVGCGVVESLLDFLLVAHSLETTTEWTLVDVYSGNPKKTDDGRWLRIDSHVMEKLPKPVPTAMTFDQILKKAEKKKVLGSDHSIYAALKRLRPLRNRVHLQLINDSTDHDWNAFKIADFRFMAEVIHKVLTSPIFSPSAAEVQYFDYLLPYVREPDPASE